MIENDTWYRLNKEDMMDALTKEKKKRLMQWPKGDLAERLLFAYSTIQLLEDEKLQLAKSLYLAANDYTSSNGSIPDWWIDCKEIARKTLELNGVKNTEQQVQADSDKPNSLT